MGNYHVGFGSGGGVGDRPADHNEADSLIEDRRAWQSVESLEWINLHVEVLAPNVAYVITKYELNATEMSGEAVTFIGRRTAVWLKRDGLWSQLLGTSSGP